MVINNITWTFKNVPKQMAVMTRGVDCSNHVVNTIFRMLQ